MAEATKLDDALSRIAAMIAKNDEASGQVTYDRPTFDGYVEAQIAKSVEDATSGKVDQSNARLELLKAAIKTAKASWDSGATTVTFNMVKDSWQLHPNSPATKSEVEVPSGLPKAGDSNVQTTSDALIVAKRAVAKSKDAPAGVFLSATPMLELLCTLAKASEKSPLHMKLAKSEEGRTLIAKAGEAKSMLTSIASMFGVSVEKDADLLDYELRWQVGDVICALQEAAKLEGVMAKMSASILAKSATEEPAAEQVEKALELDDGSWPQDLASAKLDESTGRFRDQHGRPGKRHGGWDESESLDG